MALEPKLTDYVSVIMQLFEQFMQHRIDKQGVTSAKSLTYSTCSFIIFFMLMQFRGIYGFKTQWRWLINHPEVLPMLGWQQPPPQGCQSLVCPNKYLLSEVFGICRIFDIRKDQRIDCCSMYLNQPIKCRRIAI